MKKIRMNRSDVVMTSKGPVSLNEGQEYPIDDRLTKTVADTLVGRNFAVYVKETARFLAELKNVSLEKLAEKTTHNFESLFRIEIKKPR